MRNLNLRLVHKRSIKIKTVYSVLLIVSMLAGLFSGIASAAPAAEETKVSRLKVESAINPIGIDADAPRFSWIMESGVRGQKQSAYQVIVSSSPANLEAGTGDVWDSGRIESDVSNHVEYEGETLAAATRYYWTVNVWDKDGELIQPSGQAWFETGLMGTGWSGAEWIGAPELQLDAESMPVFNIEYDIQIPDGSTKASFIFGANDPRLGNANKNNYSIAGENYIKYELDLSELAAGTGAAKLNVYRKGYGPEKGIGNLDESAPIASGTIGSITEANLRNKHHVLISVSGNAAATTVNDTAVPMSRTAYPAEAANNRLTLNPLNAVQDVPTYPRLNEIGFSADAGQTAAISNMKISNVRAPKAVVFEETVGEQYDGIFKNAVDGTLVKAENGGFTISGGSEGLLVYRNPSHTSTPMLRTEFTAAKEIANARLYATARGIYEFHINGERVGEDYFNPGHTQYNKRLMYQTYDITDLLQSGENAVGVMLASGFWSDQMTFNLSNYNYYGDRPSLYAKLVLTYADGTSETIVTDPDSWKYFGEGPVTYAGLFNGENYDAAREEAVQGWNEAGFDDSGWTSSAIITPLPEFANPEIVSQVGDNVKVFEELTAKSVSNPREGVYVYDMGVNMVGVPQIQLTGERGRVVEMRTAEMLYPDLPEYRNMNGASMVGMILTENMRAALTDDRYTLKGDPDGETYRPRFTFHGYRYLEITGLEAPLPLENVKGIVLSSITELTGSYETSNPLINQLYKNITRGQIGNFLSIPTDTPARDERMGWAGDAQVFVRTAVFNADVQQFFERYTEILRDSQAQNGGFPIYAPSFNINPASGGWLVWGAAGMIVPWETYQQYGDTRLLEEHYASMKKYVDGYRNGGKMSGRQYLTSSGGLSDHLSLVTTDGPLLINATYAYTVKLLSKAAEAIGETEDALFYQQLFDNIKSEWNGVFVDPETHKTRNAAGAVQDTQTSYSLPLAYGVFAEEHVPHAAARLAEVTRESDYIITTGFIGTAPMNPALSENGYIEDAYKLLESTKYPSWLYPVVNGSTSIWERWNSYTHENGFGGNNGMNSFNHYALGAVGSWMYNYSLGIQRDDNHPGFKHFILQPMYGGNVTYAKGEYDSVHGVIESSWKLTGNKKVFSYEAVVPANTTATLYIPAVSATQVTESGKPAAGASGIRFVEYKNGKAVYELQSGSYRFRSVLDYTGKASLKGPNRAGENDTIGFTYRLDGVDQISAQDLTIRYDQERFEFVGAESLVEGTEVEETVSSAGTVRLLLASLGAGHSISGDADVLKLTFKSKVKTGTGTIELADVKLSDGSGEVYQSEAEGKSVTLDPAILNTVKGYDIGDLGVIAYHYGKTAASGDWDAVNKADLNGDGDIGLWDLGYISRKVLNS
ncbi:family 78 glycoside hydrolase catalytic domain [Paenibacillus sp. N4]|uniref:family 78 glycoside hydrolase catalytic domain n=1 Tax=Paenibacillus vietnamensis TaxID=2590547 RepID=UPI001CD108D6|nr:family 78 glycoside hydrolase catalytic domain [Paenibacillus vietnamensis]MCA0757848.1 family 78 glycoside hydrolase catalytic domain [Paenibacillus vietnamensis]